jgi:hypothetical protein
MQSRVYTGTSDVKGFIHNKNDATEAMVDFLSYCFGMKKVGTIGDSLNSVHATGRGFDIRCYDYNKNEWLNSGFEERNWNLINYLYMNREYLGVEEIHDYVGLYVWGTMTRYDGSGRGSDANYGAGYRCDRENYQEAYAPFAWKRWDLEAHKAHEGKSVGLKHIHVEMSPASVKNKVQLLSKLDLSIKSYFRLWWHTTAFVGSGQGTSLLGTRLVNPVTIPSRKITEILKRI